MPRLLIVTTSADTSSDLFLKTDTGVQVEKKYYSSVLSEEYSSYDMVYFRDPFNEKEGFDLALVREVIASVRKANPDAYFVDAVSTIDGILFEDKWVQYQQLSVYMPQTDLYLDERLFKPGRSVIKKRISARARDVHFTSDKNYRHEGYIVQQALPVKIEYRIYTVGNDILDQVCVKSTKTADVPTKILGVSDLSTELKEYVERVQKSIPEYDLVGFDIVRTIDDAWYLLEVNRSPQFATYSELSGIQVAQKVLDHVVEKWLRSKEAFR